MSLPLRPYHIITRAVVPVILGADDGRREGGNRRMIGGRKAGQESLNRRVPEPDRFISAERGRPFAAGGIVFAGLDEGRNRLDQVDPVEQV